MVRHYVEYVNHDKPRPALEQKSHTNNFSMDDGDRVRVEDTQDEDMEDAEVHKVHTKEEWEAAKQALVQDRHNGEPCAYLSACCQHNVVRNAGV